MQHTPLTGKNLVPFRSKADSNQMNNQIEDVFYDLVDLANFINDEEKELVKLREFHEVAAHFGQEHNDQLMKEISMLKEDILAFQKPGQTYTKSVPVTQMQVDEDIEEYQRCVIDKQHDIVHLPNWGKTQSKLFLHDEVNDEYIIPNTIQYKVLPEADDITITENNFEECITPDIFSFWHRKYTHMAGMKKKVTCTVEITLPDEIITSRDVNSIYLHPFPLNTLNITNIEYKLNGGWQSIPGFKPEKKIGNTKFCFYPTEMRAIRIHIEQEHFVRKASKDIFHIGFREIGVEHAEYQTDIGRFEIPVEFSKNLKKKEIIDIVPVFKNVTALSTNDDSVRLAAFKIYEINPQGKVNYLNDTFPIQLKERRILIKALLNMDSNTQSTPALKGIEIVYKGDS